MYDVTVARMRATTLHNAIESMRARTGDAAAGQDAHLCTVDLLHACDEIERLRLACLDTARPAPVVRVSISTEGCEGADATALRGAVLAALCDYQATEPTSSPPRGGECATCGCHLSQCARCVALGPAADHEDPSLASVLRLRGYSWDRYDGTSSSRTRHICRDGVEVFAGDVTEIWSWLSTRDDDAPVATAPTEPPPSAHDVVVTAAGQLTIEPTPLPVPLTVRGEPRKRAEEPEIALASWSPDADEIARLPWHEEWIRGMLAEFRAVQQAGATARRPSVVLRAWLTRQPGTTAALRMVSK